MNKTEFFWKKNSIAFKEILGKNQNRNDTIVQYITPTSTSAPPGSVALLRGRISLLLRWMWYTFSAGTHDRGLSSGGIVTPYSQPIEYTNRHKHTQFISLQLKYRNIWFDFHLVNLEIIIKCIVIITTLHERTGRPGGK